MKFNWGHGIAIGMIAFMIFILQYVIRVQTNSTYDNQLVTENYYQEEVNINKKNEARQNAQTLGDELSIEETSEGIVIHFPTSMDIKEVKGTIKLYRPTDEKDDREFPIQFENKPSILIPHQQLKSGTWEISAQFEYKGKDYLKKKSFIL